MLHQNLQVGTLKFSRSYLNHIDYIPNFGIGYLGASLSRTLPCTLLGPTVMPLTIKLCYKICFLLPTIHKTPLLQNNIKKKKT